MEQVSHFNHMLLILNPYFTKVLSFGALDVKLGLKFNEFKLIIELEQYTSYLSTIY